MMNLALAVSLALAWVQAIGSSPKLGTLVGHVDIGPLTPVERPGVKPKVPPEMYRRYMVVVSQRGPQKGQIKSQLLRLVVKLKLTDDGDFSTRLPAGIYVVGVEPTGKYGGSESKEVVLQAGKATRVTLHVDTGIR